ncbi:MAG: metal-sensitive transcriptional regulator [Clostridiales bacterium]|nr:metal-sensitive transcriptional regulator [Clostridiales bacterium]
MDCKHDGCDLTKKLTSKLSRIEGQVRGVNKMVQEDRTCEDILVQLSAITKALEGVAKDLLSHHINHCVVDSIENGNVKDMLDKLQVAVEYYSKI